MGIDKTDAKCVIERHGSVVTNPDHPAYLGAQAPSKPVLAGQYLMQAITLGRPAVCVNIVSEVPLHLRRNVHLYHKGAESTSSEPERNR